MKIQLEAFTNKTRDFFDKKQNFLLVFSIFFITIFWRVFRLTSVPGNLSQPELNLVNSAIEITKNHWLIRPEQITNALYLYLLAGYGWLVRFNILYLRLFQGFLGFITVFLFYNFLRNWFNRQTAMLGSILFSASAFVLILSRSLTPVILLPIFFASIFLLLTNAFRTNKKLWFAIAGVCFGLSLYVSTLFSLIPVIFLIATVYYYFKNPKIITGYLWGIISAAIAFFATALPYLYYLPRNFNQILSFFNPGSIGGFYLNLGSSVQSIFYLTPLSPLYNVGSEPLIDPFIAITFIAGFFYAIFNLKRKKFLFLIGWITVFLLVLASHPGQDLSLLIVLFPAIYALAALMMDYVLTHWIRTFPFNMIARIAMTFVFSLFLFMSIFYNYQKYFYAYGKSDRLKEQYKYQIEYKR